MKRKGGTLRRTLKLISHYPTPLEILENVRKSPGWQYKTNIEQYKQRDRALVALTYLLAARISEVIRLNKTQFKVEKDRVIINSIKLSKSSRKGKPRRQQYRPLAWLSRFGERSGLTSLVLEYLETLENEEQLFSFGRVRAYQIIETITGEPCHWLRAYGENYLYDEWEKDIIAVADYIGIDPQTLPKYIRRSYTKYKPV